MAVVQIANVIVPAEFTQYQIENSFVSTALYQSGVAIPNGVMRDQLQAGAQQFTVPVWNDLADVEPNYSTDNPAQLSTPQGLTAYSQVVRKTFANQNWGAMDLAAELSGDNPLQRIQTRVQAYWNRHMEKRLIASLLGILYSNVANNSSDMVVDISGQTGTAAQFNPTSVIQAALTLGDRLEDVKAIAMHSAVYAEALAQDLIQFIPDSQGRPFKTYRGMAVIISDNLVTPTAGIYVTVLFGVGAVGYAVSEPRTSPGTELWRVPNAGLGGGETQLFSRMNIAITPAGWSWNDGTGASAIAGESPSLSDLATAAHWTRVTQQRKLNPLAFLISK